jgi:hypothetical protein
MKNDTESMIIKFLEDLSQFYHQENDLSNITCSICNTSENFKSKFLKFFFPKIDIDDVCEISREVPDCRNAGCRVDIYISMQNDDIPYIIEVKIYDYHHHFGTYDHAYQIPKERFGYITNYICREGIDQGYNVKTWEDFYKYLLNFDDNDEITNGYIQYLKNTCDITMYDKPMNAKYLSTIPCFIDSANKIINTQRDWVETTRYRTKINQDGLNILFSFKFKGQKERRDGFGSLGLWFQEPCITFGVNEREWLSKRIMDDNNNFKSKLYEEPYYEYVWNDSDVWFNMSQDTFSKFNSALTYRQQFDILNEFFEDALHGISSCFNFKG